MELIKINFPKFFFQVFTSSKFSNFFWCNLGGGGSPCSSGDHTASTIQVPLKEEIGENLFFNVAIPKGWILSSFVSRHIFPYNKWCAGIMMNKSCNISMFRCHPSILQPRTGWTSQFLASIRAFWPDGTLNCNCLDILLRFVVLGVYAVFKWELHSHGPFINQEATLNSS